MKRRITTSIIALSLLLGFELWGAGRGMKAKAARTAAPAAPAMMSSLLDPNNFTSLGASPFTQEGIYTINASKDNARPSLSGPGIATPMAGLFHDPTPADTANRDEIAVFTFDSITIPANVTV
jgi:hypothetical protein